MAFTQQMHVSIPYFTNIPEDVVTNVWSFQFGSANPSPSDWVALRARLITFYNTIFTGASGMRMAPWMVPTLTSFKGYTLSDPIPRVPRHSSIAAISPTVVTTSVLAPETAVCLSFQGVPVAGTPQARRRGRIFIGGLGAAQDAGLAAAFPNLSTTIRTTICTAALAFMTGAAADGWTWSIWSRADNAPVTVANGWVDNALDTQRRRGNTATARTTF